MDYDDELKLVKDLKEGKEFARSTFVSEYLTTLRNYAYYQHGIPRDEAEPLVIETFRKAMRSINNFNPNSPGSLLGWMGTILKNTIIDYLKKKKTDALEMSNKSYDESVIEEYDANPEMVSTLRNVEQKSIAHFFGENVRIDERSDIIISVMKKFSKEQQADLWSYLQDYSHDEIAEMRGTNPEASRKYINRLVIKFCKTICQELDKDWREIYEILKR